MSTLKEHSKIAKLKSFFTQKRLIVTVTESDKNTKIIFTGDKESIYAILTRLHYLPIQKHQGITLVTRRFGPGIITCCLEWYIVVYYQIMGRDIDLSRISSCNTKANMFRWAK